MSGRGGYGAVAATLLVTMAAVAATASARPGDLDPGFRGKGKFTHGPIPVGVAVQPDGKTLILGSNTLLRLRANGRTDKPFGTGRDDGQTDNGVPIGYSGKGAGDIALQPDGAILVLGYEDDENYKGTFVVARLTPDGALDASFGSGGRAKVPLEGTEPLDDFGPEPSMALMGDGRIVIAGGAPGAPQVARLTAAGQPDPSFGGDGSVVVDLGPAGEPRDVAVAADGKVLLAGSSKPAGGEPTDFAVARLGADGAPDPSFSADGLQTIDFGEGDAAAGVAVEPDGKVALGGTADCLDGGCKQRIAVARLDPAGELDPSFGSAGTATIRGPRAIGTFATAFERAPDGKLLVAGGADDFVLARFNADGTPDTAFGQGGITWTPFLGSYPAYGTQLALAPDGNVVVAGYVLLEEFYDELAIARYEGGPGPADRDADGLGDRKDSCPLTFGTDRSGCPVIKRELRLKREGRAGTLGLRIKVSQKSGERLYGYTQLTAHICSGDTGGAVTLYERRKGPDRRVDRDRTPGDTKLRAPGEGRFYARVERKIVTAFDPDGPVELCAAARSAAIRVGG